LRSSEIRGLPWACVDSEKNVVNVRQRADQFLQIGATKSASARRNVPMTPMVRNTLLDWRARCPASDLDLVFPTRTGRPESLGNIWNRHLSPLLCGLDLTAESGIVDEDGAPILKGRYSMHSFRHFYASWLINRRADGGLEMPAKVVQTRLGHAKVSMTLDTYSHLFPSEDSFEEMADAERLLLTGRC
jgi:integrase